MSRSRPAPWRRVALGELPLLLALLAPLLALEAQARRRNPVAERLVVQQPAPAPAYDSLLFHALEWRNIGPTRGGRVTAVSGVPNEPLTYYMGATGGGVWKTEDAGITWRNISDAYFRTGSVGSIAVAPDDANVLFVGMGEAPVRGVASSQGDGVYKSTDAGRTWTHVGLEKTRTISRVLIHPKDHDIVWVGAQGTRWVASEDRGVYKSSDGGRTWRKTLFVGPNAGVSELALDVNNPRILYAATWEHQRLPWQVRSGGPGSGIWKSTDGGDTWTRLTEGLPRATMGKTSVTVSPSNPDRVWALIEAEPEGGLYRSDDAGKTFRRINDSREIRARPWYYIVVAADPKNADVVYIMNAPFLKSIDGGRTFSTIAVPHGDQHAIWINPDNPQNIINGNDGGANISFNGGRSWSTQQNQATAQFYRVNTDNKFPYRVYSGQQDNTSVGQLGWDPSGGALDWKSWDVRAGCETAYLAFDPNDPRYTYGGCYQGIIEEHDAETGKSRNIQAWPALGLAEPSDLQKYRFNWNAPIIASAHDPKTIYHAGNRIFRSSDRGFTWTPVSPDLTRNDKTKQGLGGGPLTNEGAGGEVYSTIYALSESPVERGVIWVGTDDGLVQVTRDGGETWTDVTPRGMPNEGLVATIEASPHSGGAAYFALARYKLGDDAPYAYKTTDYGRSWTRITAGLRDAEPLRAVREDPLRRGLLFAGTETGMYVSFDDGERWQSLRLNLPRVPVTDLQVRRDGDVVIATEGRSFWVLDDIAPLREMAPNVAAAGVHLFKPSDAYRLEWASPPVLAGRNKASGALIRYVLPQAADSTQEVKLEILDAAGARVRTYSSRPRADAPAAQPGPSGAAAPRLLPVKQGMNNFAWDLRSEAPPRVTGVMNLGNPQGYRVAPGTYTARITAFGRSASQSFRVVRDPRERYTEQQVAEQVRLAKQAWERIGELHTNVTDVRSVKEQVNAVLGKIAQRTDAQDVRDLGAAIAAIADSVDARLVQAKIKTFQDVINFRNGLSDQYLYLQDAIDGSEPPLTRGMTERFGEIEAEYAPYAELVRRVLADVDRFNALLKAKGIDGVVPRRPPSRVAM
ncbi:MAG: VPS10 domain-containing protein [Gemmatimonadaceae bacterium]